MSRYPTKFAVSALAAAVLGGLGGGTVAYASPVPAASSAAAPTADAVHAGAANVVEAQTTGAQDEHPVSSDRKKGEKQKQVAQLSQVVVTGSLTGGHTVKNALQPIAVVSSTALKDTGSNRLTKVLSQKVPSLNYTNNAASDLESFDRAATLRALPAGDTLVLVNGVRWHKNALIGTLGNYGQGQQFVDLNAIPVSAIDHIEVLQNGASAQYGSDAIAGVINIILKKGAGNNSVSADSGLYSAGDGFRYHAAGSFGIPIGQQGWLRLAVEHSHQALANRAHPDRRVPQLGTTAVFGLNPFHDSNVLLNGALPVGDDAKFFFVGSYARKVGTPFEFYRFGLNTPFPKSPEMAKLFPNGFLPHQHIDERNRQLNFGLRGKTTNWHWDAEVNLGNAKDWDQTESTMNFALFHDTGNSPTSFYDGSLEAREQGISANARTSIPVNWIAGPVNVALGAQWLRDSYRVMPGALGSYYTGTSGITGGAQGFAGWAPSDAVSAARHNRAIYAQIEANITKQFKMSVSGRHSHYSDFGNNFSYAVSGRYGFNPKVALRGTVSTGFRAPSVGQESYTDFSSHSETLGNSLGLPVGIYLEGLISPDMPLARLLGSTPLQPEKAHNYSVGLVLTPTTNFTTTLDLYRVVVSNRITISSVISVTGPVVGAFLAAHGFGQQNVVGIRYFTNAGKVRAQGVDLLMEYTTDLGSGTLFSSVSANYHKNKVLSIRPNPPVLDHLGVNFQRVGRSDRLGLVGGGNAPKSKVMFNERYDTGNWEVGASLTRYGKYTSFNDTLPALDQTFTPEWLLDVHASYFFGRWRFTLGSDNIGNNYPDRVEPEENNHGEFPYPELSPFGFDGAFYYGRISYSW